jgi:ketosteroid isomerase-like protein
MSDSAANVALVEEALAAFARGDLEATFSFMDEDIETHSPPSLANAGTFRGTEGFLTWSAEWLEAFEEWSQEISNCEAVGDRHVVVDAHQTGRGAGSGVPVEMRLAYMFEIRNGRGVRFHLYPDREEALEAARRGESEAGD